MHPCFFIYGEAGIVNRLLWYCNGIVHIVGLEDYQAMRIFVANARYEPKQKISQADPRKYIFQRH